MQLRDALITRAPSLALQRAAASEIARLDSLVGELLRANLAAAAALNGPVSFEEDAGRALRTVRAAVLRASL